MMEEYLKETAMLNYCDKSIQALIDKKHWRELDEFNAIKAVYDYIRDEILFGYNVDDVIQASKVLADGYGQCNTKGILFMSLLRALKIPCRVHGFTVDKRLQKGAMTGFVYKSAPQNIVHTWVEVYFADKWYDLEAYILDKEYLEKLQIINKDHKGEFWGYGVAVKDLMNVMVDWNMNSTYIQSEGITQDFGVYNSPDILLKEHHQNMSKVNAFIFRNIGRHLMNRNIKNIRNYVINS